MKVKITYTEKQTFEFTKEVEMTKTEYKRFIDDKEACEEAYDLCASADEEYWVSTEMESLHLEPLMK